MTLTLPTPGGDTNTWGDELNAYIKGRHRSIARGLAVPNPGGARFHATPTVMASAPAITLGVANAASVITNSVLVGAASSQFLYGGCRGSIETTFNLFYRPGNLGTLAVEAAYYVEFEWYGSEFEMWTQGRSSSAAYRLTVDGEGYDARGGRTDLPNDGNGYLVHYDFSSTAFRRIRLDFASNCSFGGIRIGPNDSLWRTSKPQGPKVAVIGDSFAEGMNHWPEMMGWLLGWGDIYMAGKGSTGYLDESAGDDTYRDRIAADIIPHDPDIVIVSGGINDSVNADEAAVGAEATLLYAAIASGLPDATLIVSGMQYPAGSVGDTAIRVAFAIRDAALASDAVDLYLDQLGLGVGVYSGTASDYNDDGWMTGTGRVGATTGSGNADIFTSSDNTHPTQDGHDYRGYRHASAVAALMPIPAVSE